MKSFIVLGMHRSATSLVAKGLLQAGVHMGDRLLGSHASNPYGHFEDVDFIYLNDQILKAAGGSWLNPPDETNIIKAGEANGQKIKDFIDIKQVHDLWGWKDPRTALTIRCFIPYLENPHFIACYRHPKAVAESLNKRDGMPIQKGVELARIYNQRIKNFLSEFTE